MRRTLSIAILAAAFGCTSSAPAEDREASSDGLDIVVLSDSAMLRVRFEVRVGEATSVAAWDKAFAGLFAFHDRNSDGFLDRKEADRLPSAFYLRQVMWGMIGPFSGSPPDWTDLDVDRDGKARLEELAGYYRRAGLGGPLVGMGKVPVAGTLTDSILKRLDKDGNGTVDEAEWNAAPTSLGGLDANGDELVGPGEIVAKVAYPGTTGSLLLSPPSAGSKPKPELDSSPILVLPAQGGDDSWSARLVERRDKNRDGGLDAREAGLAAETFTRLDVDANGRLAPSELAGWRKLPADHIFKIGFGTTDSTAPSVVALDGTGSTERAPVVSSDRLRFIVRADGGQLPPLVSKARDHYRSKFAEADTNRDGFVDRGDKSPPTDLKPLLTLADRNCDDRLSEAEFTAWLDVQTDIARGHVLVTVVDYGRGLFEVLDADADGALSTRELRSCIGSLQTAGAWRERRFDAERLPQRLTATTARGHPTSLLVVPVRTAGPNWFRAMDRNRDGDVSRREFSGPIEAFDRLDIDRDDLLSPVEAEKAPPSNTK